MLFKLLHHDILDETKTAGKIVAASKAIFLFGKIYRFSKYIPISLYLRAKFEKCYLSPEKIFERATIAAIIIVFLLLTGMWGGVLPKEYYTSALIFSIILLALRFIFKFYFVIKNTKLKRSKFSNLPNEPTDD